MLKKLVLFTVTLCLSQFVLAKPHPKPVQCPNISVVQAEGFSQAQVLSGTSYAVIQFSHYDLKELWGFVILPVEARDEGHAIQKGHEILKSVSGTPSPQLDDSGSWFCQYQAPGDYYALAVADVDKVTFSTVVHKFNR